MRHTVSLALAAALGLAASPAFAETLSFTLENQTDNMIVQFHVSPADGGKGSELLSKKGALWRPVAQADHRRWQ
jgi:hypothetical protein